MIFKRKSEQQPARNTVTRASLERSLAEAVRASHPEFETFVGVIVERVVPARSEDPNWAIKGVKYGKTDRHRSGIILLHCVELAQLEFNVLD